MARYAFGARRRPRVRQPCERQQSARSSQSGWVDERQHPDQERSRFEPAPVAHVTPSPDGRVFDGNSLAARILRLTQTQLLQRHFEDFIAPADME